MIPMGDWAEPRLKKLSENDQKRISSATKSGFGKTLGRWVGKDMVYPTNVLHLPAECGNKNHSAVFPAALPEWFIKLFSDEGDVVFDPFLGSGTTALAAQNLNRHYIGTEIQPEYFRVAQQRIGIRLMDDDTRNFFDGLVEDAGYVADESSCEDLCENIVEDEPLFRFDDNQN
jgi:DNA modification methylase